MAGTISLASYMAKIELDQTGLNLGLDQANKNIQDSLGKSMEASFKSLGTGMDNMGKSMSKISIPLIGLGVVAGKVGMDFQAGMSEVGAISQASAADMELLTEKAKEMGATTKFSATESAEALKYMSMAGWDTNQMMGGLDGVMMLAAASGESLASVSDIVTDALTGFGMKASQAGEFADLLASASSNSNTNVAMMGETFKYVAPLFGSLGYSAEDAALATGLLANAGIKGGQAGTVLRGAITNLINPTDKMAGAMKDLGISMTDTNGEMLPFNDVLIMLREKFAGLSEEQQAQMAATIFGKEAMSGMLAVINASDADFAKLTNATRDYNGVAKEMADVMGDNLPGRITILKSALEGLGLKIFELMLPAMEGFVNITSKVVDWLDNLDEGTQKNIVTIGGLLAVASPLLIVGGKVAGGIGSMIGLFGGLSTATAAATVGAGGLATATAGAGTAFSASALLLNPWTLGIGAAIVSGIALNKHMSEDSIPALELFGEGISSATEEAVTGFLNLETQATEALNQLSWSGAAVTEEMKESIIGNFDAMKTGVVAKLEEQKTDAIKSLEELFAKSTSLSEEEKDGMLKIATEKYDEQIKTNEEGNARIKEILEQAVVDNREISNREKIEINKIKEDMKNDGVRLYSETEKESLLILEKLRQGAGVTSAKMASEVVKNSLDQKDKSIINAQKEYEDRLKYAATLRAEGSKEAIELADKVVAEAKKQREGAVKEAEEMHIKVVDEAKRQAKDYVNEIDWMSGEVKSKWEMMRFNIVDSLEKIDQKLKDGIKSLLNWNNTKVNDKVFNTTENVTRNMRSNDMSGSVAKYEKGTNFVPQTGYALVHKGETIIPASKQGAPYKGNGNGGNNFNSQYDITLQVQGNMDRSILPEVQRMIKSAIKESDFTKMKELNKVGIFRSI